MRWKNIKPPGAFRLLAFVLALTWGAGSAWAEGTFYVAPKIIIGRQKTSFGAPAMEVKRGYWQSVYDPGSYPKYTGKYEGLGLAADDTNLFGALAVGADLYERLNLPLRLELEISMTGDAKRQGETSRTADPRDPSNDKQTIVIDTQSLAYNMHTAFLNAYADWHNGSRFTPYVGGGLGAAIIKGRATIRGRGGELKMAREDNDQDDGALGFGGYVTDFEKRAVNFAWHLDAGVSFNLTEKTAIDLGYRYLNVGRALSLDGDPKDMLSAREYLSAPKVEGWLYGPREIKFEPTHQATLAFRYSF